MTMSDGPQRDAQNFNIYPLLKIMFGEYVAEHELATNEVENVDLDDFVAFLLEMDIKPDWVPPTDQVGLPESVWPDLMNNLRETGTLPGMKEQWMGFIMGCRPAPKHELGAIQVIVNLRFRDGRVCPMTCYIPEELSEPLTDAAVCLVIQQQFQAMYETVKSRSVDGLYDDGYMPGDKNVPPNKISQTPGDPVFPAEVVEQILTVRQMNGIKSQCPPNAIRELFKNTENVTSVLSEVPRGKPFTSFAALKMPVDTAPEPGENQEDSPKQ